MNMVNRGMLPGAMQDRTARANALALPSRRTQAFKVMASPPTVAAINSGASAITSAQTVSSLANPGTAGSAVSTGKFTYLGCGGITQSGTTYPIYNYVKSTHLTTTLSNTNAISVEFGFDGTQVEILTYGGGGAMLVSVDGEYVSATPVSVPADGNPYHCLYTFATRSTRIIRIELTNLYFGGVKVGPNDTVWAAGGGGPKCVFVGDSFVEGTNSTLGLGMVVHFRERIGWPNTIASGVGGTGYINPGSGGRVKFIDRITNDVINQTPDVVIVAGGLNDTSSTAGDTATAAAAYFAALRSGLPNAQLICMGPMNPTATSSATGAHETAIFAAVAPYVRGTVAQASAGWITGTGKVGATTGTGNRDLLISSDGTHPSPAGHEMFGARIAEAVRAILR